MKRILSFILTLVMVLTSFVGANFICVVDSVYVIDTVYANENEPQDSFPDVNSLDWFYNNVTEMVSLGIVDGYPDGTFKPQGPLTADAFIKMLIIGMGYQPKSTDSTYWADGYIQKAEELKIVDKTFINDYRYNLTREQASKIIVNALSLNETRPSSTYNEYIKAAIKDYHLIADKYKQDTIDSYNFGIMQGNPDKKVNPKSTITRAEATTVVLRMINKDRRLSAVKELNLDKYSITLKDAEGKEHIIVAPLLNGKPVVEVVDFARIWLENLDKTKGSDGIDYAPFVNMIRVGGKENQEKRDYINSLKGKPQLSNEELTKVAMYSDYTFNMSLIDLTGKYTPFKFNAWKNLAWLDDETYKNQIGRWGEYFTVYYLDAFKPIFKYLFEDDYDKAWKMFVDGINSNSSTWIRKSEVLNERYFDIVYDASGVSLSISLKNEYK